MAFLVPFSTAGNGLWEMNKWEMGFGWLLWLWGLRYEIRGKERIY